MLETSTSLISPISCERSSAQSVGVQMSYVDTQAFDSTLLKWRNLSEVYEHCNLCIVEPENFDNDAQDDAWKVAMQEEINNIEKNKTWELVNRPLDKLVIGVSGYIRLS